MDEIWAEYRFIAWLTAVVFCIMLLAAFFRLIGYIREQQQREVQKLDAFKREAEDEALAEYEESEKEIFKQEVEQLLNICMQKKRPQIKKAMLREKLYAQSRQYEKLKKAALAKIVRNVLYEFRSRFLKNMRQALIAKLQKKKGQKTRISRMQEAAIKELEQENEQLKDRQKQREQKKEKEREQAERNRANQEKEKQLELEKEIARLKEEEQRAKEVEEKERLRKEREQKEQQQREQKAQQQAKQQAAQQAAAQQAASQSGGHSGGR